jgi:6-phosphogluconolactonase (cycloisomerase 2 family)
MVLHPKGNALYVLYSNVSCDTGTGDGLIQMYTVSPSNGKLTLQSTAGMTVAMCPQQFAITPSGNYMYVAGNAGFVGAEALVVFFSIDNNGYLMSADTPNFWTGFNAVNSILFTPNSQFVYFAGNHYGHSSLGSLLAASINSGNGRLTELDSTANPYLYDGSGRGVIDAAGAHLYVGDYYMSQAETLNIDSGSGALTKFSGWGYGNWAVYDLAFDPATPNLLYVASAYGMYHGVIDFTQDATGNVTSKNSANLVSVDDWANRLLVNPGGGLIYVGTNSGKILVESVDPNSGAITQLQTVSPFSSANGGITFGFLPPGTGNIEY